MSVTEVPAPSPAPRSTESGETPAVRLDHVSKRFEQTFAVRDLELDIAQGSSSPCSAPPAAARPPACG
ncbi:hypothetical protein GXW82_01830 [Streptacidiphilus sp. 4-A2]|nr:hypothetical protein [Streptacidiphilus sp. 4-A2]